MYFDSFDALIAMDGHGVFVWTAYAVTLLILALLVVAPMRRRRHSLKQLLGEMKRSGELSSTEGG